METGIWGRFVRPAALTAACALVLLSLAPPSAGSDRAEQLPNLVAMAPFDLEIGEADTDAPGRPAGPALRFATGANNRSDYALELSGQPSGTTEAVAQQCVAWAAPRVCTERKEVGTFAWHPEHGHFHFQDFALYELRRLRPNGEVDMRRRGLVATSGKVSFCIIDVERDENRGPLYTAPYPLYYSCLAGLSMQGISPGWRDVYANSTVGQQIPLEGIEDGIYALVVVIDPLNRLLESDDTDNSAVVHIRLSGEVEILCDQVPGETACEPDPPADEPGL
ncbi:MAG TPA: lysyl oxidase family protein [Actinomycetota bacterium]|nr:lysyl oxidase family protein [Actinomycetota bacterium]